MPNEAIGMIGEMAVAIKATQVVRDVAPMALAARLSAHATRDTQHAECGGSTLVTRNEER